MMKIKLAKSLMENEEGTNHLWIKIPTIASLTAKHVQISIHLPKGLYRLKNLNGYYEDKSGTIFIDDFSKKDDLIIEIFTQEQISCKEEMINVDFKYKEKLVQEGRISQCILLSFVREDEMDYVVIDEEVADRVKQLLNLPNDDEMSQEMEFVMITPKIQNVSNQISYLERKYRIDF